MLKQNGNADDNRFPERKNPRMKHYDYSTPNYYFITICTHEKRCLFWTNGKLNSLGEIVQRGIMGIQEHFLNNAVDHFVIMPNHIHLILIVKPGGASVPVVVGSLKSYISKKIHTRYPGLEIWQKSFHDHGIRGQWDYEKIWNYIETNPIRWEMDCFYSKL